MQGKRILGNAVDTRVYLSGEGDTAVDLSHRGSCVFAKNVVIENGIPGQPEVIDNRQIHFFLYEHIFAV